jgi:hypothetical protein
VIARRAEAVLPANGTAAAIAACVEGEFAVGGGAGYVGEQDGSVAILVSEPLDANGDPPATGQRATAWQAFARNVANDAETLIVHVLCTKG